MRMKVFALFDGGKLVFVVLVEDERRRLRWAICFRPSIERKEEDPSTSLRVTRR